MSNDNDGYLNFDEYIRQGEPSRKEKAGYWQTAIGLQAVDGLTVSDYLQDTARRHIEGDITIDDARELVNQSTSEWSVQPNLATPTSTPASTPTSTLANNLNPNSKFYTNNNAIIELVRVIGAEELSIKQMMEIKGLKDRKNFIDYHLEPALKEKFVRRKYPDRPNHPRQKYLLTAKGLALFNEQKK